VPGNMLRLAHSLLSRLSEHLLRQTGVGGKQQAGENQAANGTRMRAQELSSLCHRLNASRASLRAALCAALPLFTARAVLRHRAKELRGLALRLFAHRGKSRHRLRGTRATARHLRTLPRRHARAIV